MTPEQLRALVRIMAAHGKPLFPREGPEFYTRAFQHNVPFAQGAPYRTMLSPIEEAQFRKWLASTGNPGNFNPDAWVADYDMRGYWKEQVMGGGSNLIRMNPNDKRLHGPDIYKTPYDTTFSGESKYAVPGTPFHWWPHDNLIDYRTGQLVIGPGQ